MKKVLVTDFHLDWGGQPRYLLDVAKSLKSRIETIFLTPTGSILQERAEKEGIICATIKGFNDGTELWPDQGDVTNIAELLQKFSPDIVHVNGYRDQISTSFAVETYVPHVPVFKLKHNSFAIPETLINRYCYRHLFDHVGVVANGILNKFEWLFKEEILNPENISIHHSGLNFDDYSQYKKHWNISITEKDTITLGIVARLAPEKGIDILIETISQINKLPTNKRFKLIIVGEGPEQANLINLVKHLGIEQLVNFTGFIEDVRPILLEFDFFILPSVDCEGSSLALKEAMAVGLPVITTDIGGSPEIINHKSNGFLVSSNSVKGLMDQILKLSKMSAQEIQSISDLARKTIKHHFTLSKLADSLFAIYEELIENP